MSKCVFLLMNQRDAVVPLPAMKGFPAEELFAIEEVVSYGKEDLVDVSDGAQR